MTEVTGPASPAKPTNFNFGLSALPGPASRPPFLPSANKPLANNETSPTPNDQFLGSGNLGIKPGPGKFGVKVFVKF